MNLKDFREGLGILARYYEKPDGYYLSAEHDVIYAHATTKPLSKESVERMIELGWIQEGLKRGDYSETFNATQYDPEESWCAYV